MVHATSGDGAKPLCCYRLKWLQMLTPSHWEVIEDVPNVGPQRSKGLLVVASDTMLSAALVAKENVRSCLS